MFKLYRGNERGSLSLEQVLFIGAIVLMGTGLTVFFDNIRGYFAGVGFSSSPTNVGNGSR